jgi:hypothetical protein
MNQLIRIIENADTLMRNSAMLPSGFDEVSFVRAIESAVYGRSFTRYLLLKLDFSLSR